MFEQASKIHEMNKSFSFVFSEHSTRNKLFLRVGLDKRSGHSEQWPKSPQKYDLFRKIRLFSGRLDEFGEIWIPIWMFC